jgi:deazaflavin-dependent oxidoreductase (nitroreductase family)
MAAYDQAVIDAVAREREVELTTYGRVSGNPSKRILWAYTDGERVFLRSGGGLGRDWPQNLLANGRGVLHAGGHDVEVTARHVTDVAEARRTGELARNKYGDSITITSEGEEPTPGEQATFELIPA